MTRPSYLKDYKLDKNGKLKPVQKGSVSDRIRAKKSKRVRVSRAPRTT